MADFGDIAGGALSGATTGAAFGPWGAAIGGVAGGILGAFDSSPSQDTSQFSDPFAGILQGQGLSDINSHLGADEANQAKAGIEERAREQERDFNNNPDFAGNASVQSAFYNKSRGTAEGNMIDANLKGAELDQATHEKGFQELSGMRNFDYGKYLNDVELQRQPSFFESLAQEGLSSFAGGFAGSMGTKFGKKMGSNGNGSLPAGSPVPDDGSIPDMG